jgi:hypothetical protein
VFESGGDSTAVIDRSTNKTVTQTAVAVLPAVLVGGDEPTKFYFTSVTVDDIPEAIKTRGENLWKELLVEANRLNKLFTTAAQRGLFKSRAALSQATSASGLKSQFYQNRSLPPSINGGQGFVQKYANAAEVINNGATFKVKDVDKFMEALASEYKLLQNVNQTAVLGTNTLNPFLASKIRAYIVANPNGVPIGAGVPGLHAEIFAVNDILNQLMVTVENSTDAAKAAEIQAIVVATAKTGNANQNKDFNDDFQFEACNNCSGILKDLGYIATGSKN